MEIQNQINSRILDNNNIEEIADIAYSNLQEKCKIISLVIINVFSSDDMEKNELKIMADSMGSRVSNTEEVSEDGEDFRRDILDIIKMGGHFFKTGSFAVQKDPDSIKEKSIYKALAAFPIYIDHIFRGSLEIFTAKESEFSRKEINFFRDIASALAGALNHYIIFSKQKKASEIFEASFSNIIELLVSLIEIRDKYTSGHSSNVKDISILISNELGLNEKEISEISFAANLHDVGKIGISESILNKPARLTNKEFEDIKRHPVQGAFILANIPQLKNIGKLILHHHERFDGGGYPVGISGSEIPLGSRIISVGDAYDAMTSKRSYRDEIKKQDAVNIINEESGHQFDPEIVKAFIKIAPKISNKSSSILENIIEKDLEI